MNLRQNETDGKMSGVMIHARVVVARSLRNAMVPDTRQVPLIMYSKKSYDYNG